MMGGMSLTALNDANDLLADVDAAARARPRAWRLSAVQQLADLFVAQAEVLDTAHVALLDEVICRLIDFSDEDHCKMLTSRLSKLANGPPLAIVRLAQHRSIAIAADIIENSPVLSESSLETIIATGKPQHLLAVTRRDSISSQVCDLLMAHEIAEVARSLVANPGASFSELAFVKLVDAARKDEHLAQNLKARPDMPEELRAFLMLSINQ